MTLFIFLSFIPNEIPNYQTNMKIIDNTLLNNLSTQATNNVRLRMNYNLHDTTDDPFNRFLNAMQPNTYIRPHKHASPPRSEGVVVLRGELAVIIFNNDGSVKQIEIVNPTKGVWGVDIAPNEWHMSVILEPDTVIYEAKPGPYAPIAECDWAPWAPLAENKDEVEKYIASICEHINNYKAKADKR